MSEWLQHDGSGYPPGAVKGALVRTMQFDGVVRVAVMECGAVNGITRRGLASPWFWKMFPNSKNPHARVKQYHIVDTDDKAKREARMAEFTRIAEEGLKIDRPVKSPQKVGAEQ